MSEPSDKGLAKPGWLNKSDKAAAWVAVVGLCLVVWSQLRAAIPQAFWEKLPRPALAVLDVLAANWGSAKNGSGTDQLIDQARPAAGSSPNTKSWAS